jgi:hypothetical protein
MDGNTRESKIDSTECLLTPILVAFSRIQARAEEMALEERSPTAQLMPKLRRHGSPRGGNWKDRWAPVKVALEDLDRALKNSGIPQSSLRCGFCDGPIVEGGLHTFHAMCYEQRFEPTVDWTRVKRQVTMGLPPGHPARELTLHLPDALSKVELPGVAVSLLHLLQDRGNGWGPASSASYCVVGRVFCFGG